MLPSPRQQQPAQPSPIPPNLPPIQLPPSPQNGYGDSTSIKPSSPSPSSSSSSYSNSQLRVRASPRTPASTAHAQARLTYSSSRGSSVTPTPSPGPISGSLHARQREGYNENVPMYERDEDPSASLSPQQNLHGNYKSASTAATRFLQAAAAVLTPRRVGGTPKRKLSGAGLTMTEMGSQRSGSTLFLHLLFFVTGMIFAYILLLSTSHTAADLHSEKLMYWFKQGASSHPSTTANTPQAMASSEPVLPWCGPDEFTDGEWVYDETITTPAYKSHEWDNACDATAGYTNDPNDPKPTGPPQIRKELQWVWKPNKCRLAPYSRKNFCELLNRRNVLFVGDSIAQQHVFSFVHLLHEAPDNLWIRDEFWRYDQMTVCQDIFPAEDESTLKPRAGRHPHTNQVNSGIRVGFKRNNFLNLHTEVNNTVEYRKHSTNSSWIGEIDLHGYDIVVMNTGIWMVDADIYRDMLTSISKYMSENHPHVTLIWRSTQPGHAACHTHWARPQKRLYNSWDTKGGSERFRWEEADERNRIAREFFPTQFLDVATPTKLRPDGHMPGECLHYCAPGPHDEWNKFLFHRLSLLNPTFLAKIDTETSQTNNVGFTAQEIPGARKKMCTDC